MAKAAKNQIKKSAPEKPVQGTEQLTKKGEEVFKKLKKHFEPAKVDAWQEKWLAIPENRKKYEKLADAPEVMGEELVAMTNDIIQFAQGQEGGTSEVFKKLKKSGSAFFKNPIAFIQSKAAKAETVPEAKTKSPKKADKKPKSNGKKK